MVQKNFKLWLKKYLLKGKLAWEYNPFWNLKKKNDNGESELTYFDTNKIKTDIYHPVNIECQQSYDESCNLILNDDNNIPLLVNSAFSVIEDNGFRRIQRNQEIQTNYYREETLSSEARLQRVVSKDYFANIELQSVTNGGTLPGGNYTFYIRLADEDENLTGVICESSIVSIYHGNDIIHTRGTLMEETTDKKISLIINNLDPAFSKLQLCYCRAYSDLNGIEKLEYKSIKELYYINCNEDKQFNIVLTGYEVTDDISKEDLNIDYNIYTKVKTQTQIQNMLFFGNVDQTVPDNVKLQDISYYIQVMCTQDTSSTVNTITTNYLVRGTAEYYDTDNIYNYLGYMPNEFYRLGVVYIFDDDTLSPVYNLRGCIFNTINDINTVNTYLGTDPNLYIKESEIFDGNTNLKGVFKTPDVNIVIGSNVRPLHFNFYFQDSMLEELKAMNIKGYFFVRQKRIPIFLAQGYSIGISDNAHIPMLPYYDNELKYYTNGPISPKFSSWGQEVQRRLNNATYILTQNNIITSSNIVSSKGLICNDATFNKSLQSILYGNQCKLKKVAEYSLPLTPTDHVFNSQIQTISDKPKTKSVNLAYIPAETSSMIINNLTFSSKAGSSEDIQSLRSVSWSETDTDKLCDENVVRGNFTGYVAVLDDEIEPLSIYNIYSTEYSEDDYSTIITARAQNEEPFTAITNRVSIDTKEINAYRGDCFTGVTSTKMCYNFLDSNTPLNTNIVKPNLLQRNKVWGKKYTDIAWDDHNLSDWNAVPFGHIFSYRYISNYNLSLRCINDQNTSEKALYGSDRGFYPYFKYSKEASWKIPDSTLLNAGLSHTQNEVTHFGVEQVPYVRDIFDTRIAFSNVQLQNSFKNSFRIFQGLSYQDVDRSYGALVKLLPYGSNLFGVFEHGLGIIPVNEKALIQTQTGQSIHMYGAGVIQNQISVISQDYGSTWQDSIIVTPGGIYGVDTWAKKIWRFNSQGFTIISDQIVNRFLIDNIKLDQSDLYPIVAYKNVKTHYNNFKGDVMFTFYKDNTVWNICYNERIGKWTTRYSWTPLLSANIQNSFISIDQQAAEIYTGIARNKSENNCLRSEFNVNCRYPWIYDNEHWGTYKTETQKICDLDENGNCQYELDDNGDKIFDKDGHAIKKTKQVTVDHPSMFCFSLSGFNDVYNYANVRLRRVYYPKYNTNTKEYEIKDIDFYDTDHVLYFDDSTYIGWNNDSKTYNLNKNLSSDLEVAWRDSWDNYIEVASGPKVGVSIKLKDEFIPWIKIDVAVIPQTCDLPDEPEGDSESDDTSSSINRPDYKKLTNVVGKEFSQSLYFIADYDDIKNKLDSKIQVNGDPIDDEYKLESDHKMSLEGVKQIFDDTLRLGLYTHGRAGIYDEIDYFDKSLDNQILPCRWYNKQEPFELEFVVNTNIGMQKIFNNLVIISNNVQPNEIEYQIIGDAYDFNKSGIFRANNFVEPVFKLDDPKDPGIFDSVQYFKNQVEEEFKNSEYSQDLNINIGEYKFNTDIEWDTVLNQYMLKTTQDCRDVKQYGKRLGNIEYKEDKWNIVVTPIYFRKKTGKVLSEEDGKVTEVELIKSNTLSSTRIRDKWIKVRIKYKGDKLVVISAIQSLLSLSYA